MGVGLFHAADGFGFGSPPAPRVVKGVECSGRQMRGRRFRAAVGGRRCDRRVHLGYYDTESEARNAEQQYRVTVARG